MFILDSGFEIEKTKGMRNMEVEEFINSCRVNISLRNAIEALERWLSSSCLLLFQRN